MKGALFLKRRSKMIPLATIVIFGCLMILAFAPFALAQGARELRLCHNSNIDSATDKASHKFAELVEKKTGGQVKVIIYPRNHCPLHGYPDPTRCLDSLPNQPDGRNFTRKDLRAHDSLSGLHDHNLAPGSLLYPHHHLGSKFNEELIPHARLATREA